MALMMMVQTNDNDTASTGRVVLVTGKGTTCGAGRRNVHNLNGDMWAIFPL